MLYIGAVLMYFMIPIEHSDLAAPASKHIIISSLGFHTIVTKKHRELCTTVRLY